MDGLSEALRAAGTLDLYRANAFRVAGLAVDASPAQLRRRATELRAARSLGGAPRTAPQPLPPAAPPEAEQVEQALARLREPAGRLVDEFFWFWPGDDGRDDGQGSPRHGGDQGSGRDGGQDAGLAALGDGDVERAEAIWQAAGTAGAVHNLAVLNHAMALDDEQAGTPPRRAYQHWRAVWQAEAFWAGFAGRVARTGHPGSGPATVALFREHLPLVLASTSAAVALHGAELLDRATGDALLAQAGQAVQCRDYTTLRNLNVRLRGLLPTPPPPPEPFSTVRRG
ncbi:hypothetical protein OHA72_34070 [Dactylosporangium sp. NBC_01737]|uniref:hypothetical protein n=1 Tax=Dactylosporangium sp. NBC_01737 TaxID=2975959 RepID=UPI002E0D924A|nr:hypothetical protein OHA72_34070 [Dactylosporangium sp. NBC_01737]